MLRAVIAVFAGYLVMALLVFASLSLTFLALGAEAAFKPGTFEPSTTWVSVSLVLSFIAAVVGGWVCATIAKQSRAPLAFAALVFGLGLMLVGYVLMVPVPRREPVRGGNISTMQAMQSGSQPVWVTILNPIIAAAGIIVGARLKGAPKSRTTTASAD